MDTRTLRVDEYHEVSLHTLVARSGITKYLQREGKKDPKGLSRMVPSAPPRRILAFEGRTLGRATRIKETSA